jgi:hypothetical protein
VSVAPGTTTIDVVVLVTVVSMVAVALTVATLVTVEDAVTVDLRVVVTSKVLVDTWRKSEQKADAFRNDTIERTGFLSHEFSPRGALGSAAAETAEASGSKAKKADDRRVITRSGCE